MRNRDTAVGSSDIHYSVPFINYETVRGSKGIDE